MRPHLTSFVVRTLHRNSEAGNAFIVPFLIEEVGTAQAAARQRFDKLSSHEQANCCALLVQPLLGPPRLFEVEKISEPRYVIKPSN